MRPRGWAGLLGHGDVPTPSQHSRWTQAPCRHQLLSPSEQLDMVSCFLLCLSRSFRSSSRCYPELSLLLAGFAKNLDFPPYLYADVAQSRLPRSTSPIQALLRLKSQVPLPGSPIIIANLSARRRIYALQKSPKEMILPLFVLKKGWKPKEEVKKKKRVGRS